MSLDRGYHILIVDDNEAMLADIKRELEDSLTDEYPLLSITSCGNFGDAEELLTRGSFDLAILDIREEAGTGQVADDLRGTKSFEIVRATKFLPVIFFTAFPLRATSLLAPPLVTVVDKDELETLPDVVRQVIDTGLATTVNALNEHVNRVMREYLWDTVATSWSSYSAGNPAQLAKILVERISRSLLENGLDEVSNALQELPRADGDSVKPGAAFEADIASMYVYPPVSPKLVPGAILTSLDPEGGLLSGGAVRSEDWFVVLTPACDLEQNKVDFVLLARAVPLTSMSEYQNWATGYSSNAWNKLAPVVTSSKQRYQFLARFEAIPDLVVDFEQVLAVSQEDLNSAEPIATLASPFAEALITRYSHFRGRIGMPDLNKSLLQERIKVVPE